MSTDRTPGGVTARKRKTIREKIAEIWGDCPLIPVDPPSNLRGQKALDWTRIAGQTAVSC